MISEFLSKKTQILLSNRLTKNAVLYVDSVKSISYFYK